MDQAISASERPAPVLFSDTRRVTDVRSRAPLASHLCYIKAGFRVRVY